MLSWICYVSKATQEGDGSRGLPSAKDLCFIAMLGSIVRGRRWQKCPDQTNATRKRRKLERTGGNGSSDACPLGDAAQSVTHLDVLACVVAS
jgi:hypothetical protein